MQESAILLHNIRSAHNVGAIMRTADGAGVAHVYLSGYTPRPVDRFGRSDTQLAKTALGAQHSLPWTYRVDPMPLIASLRRDGWHVVGVEQDARSRNYRTLTLPAKTLFIFGNEVRGLSQGLREACDMLIEIPMRGKKESLNVAVAAGIILFHFAP